MDSAGFSIPPLPVNQTHRNIKTTPAFPIRALAPLLGSIALMLPGALFADSIKASNTTALNATGSWTNATVPNAANLAIWDSTITAANSSQLGGDLSWLGIKVGNVGGAANSTVLMTIANTSSANTLTLGTGGIDMSAATQGLAIQSKITLAGTQTWNVANANTATAVAGLNISEDLSFLCQVAGAAFNLGGFTVNKTGVGTAALSSGYTVSNGTFDVNAGVLHFQSGGSRVETLNSDVNLVVNSGGTLALAVQSAATNVNAQITLNTGSTLNIVPGQANPLTLGATGSINVAGNTTISVTPQLNTAQNAGATLLVNSNITGAGNITYNNSVTVVNLLRLAGDNSGYSGTLTMAAGAGARTLRLQSATAGSAAATWEISTGNTLQINGVGVNLGTLNGAGSVTNTHASNAATISVGAGNFSGAISNGAPTMALTKVGTGTLTLTGANSYTGATTVSGGTLLVSAGALNGTAVSVASTATYAVQSAFSASANTAVTVADGGTFSARPQAAGVTINVPSLTVGTATGGTINIGTAALGNPTVAPLDVTALTVNTGSLLKVTGSALVPALGIPLLSYTGAIGGAGFGGLTLQLPARTVGNLVNNAGAFRVDLDITSFEQVKWRGNVNALWDIDPTGADVVGTQNWRTTITNTAARYLQGTGGTDSANFDDSAVGNTNVNLTTTLTPGGVVVNNTALNYTFSGAGKISGGASLTKSGNGTLTFANSVAYDYTGGTTISAGTLQIGDGATAGVGILPTSTITNNGTLALSRPDNFSVTATITGTGTLAKNNANTVTFPSATTLGDVAINAGALKFTAGGALTGALSGPGTLESGGGTLQLNGGTANTNSGVTTVSAGLLQLAKGAGVNAVGGNIAISGTGQLALLAGEQIPDSATITFIGSSTDSIPTQSGGETVANVIVNSSVPGAPGGQVILRNGFNILGTGTLNSGILGVGSGQTATANAINITAAPGSSAILRIAGNSAGSTLNIGAGGITASGGEIQVKFNANNQDAVINLGGDFTATGNVAITNAGYTGPNLNAINLSAGQHTFSIATGTTTTVAPEISGAGGLTKTGNGTLSLTALSASNYTGDTIVTQGTLLTTPAQVAAAVILGGGATLSVNLDTVGTTFLTSSLTTATNSTLVLATGALGNPTAPVIATGPLTINGTTKLRITGSALTTATGIPLISYGSTGGAEGLGGLDLILPGRIGGELVDNTVDSRVDLNIFGIEQIKWRGNTNGNWDIDPDGTGATGTLNWRTTLSNNATRYFQGPIGIDTANFDDSATGTTSVVLTTTLSPNGVNVNNSTKDYTFTGTGKISGATALTKTGTGTLTIANTGANDYTGGTTIGVGSILKLGNGVTNGAGSVPGAIVNDGTLVLNRPDDVGFTNTLSGSGTLQKDQANTVTFSAATTLFTPIVLNAGTLKFSGGGTLGGSLSGPGGLEAGGGTLQINGGVSNTNTGVTTVSAGILQLAMTAGVNAVGGNVLITGTGQLALLAGEQIPDTATITFTGTSTDSIPAPVGQETVANVIVNSSVGGAAGGQVIMRNGFTVLGTATLTNGILGVASGNTATVNGIVINAAPGSNAILRIAGNSAGSTLNVGPGGITASGGEIQVKFNTNNQDAVLNLGGDFIATGDVAITNAGYTGPNASVINLTGGDRTFDIAAGTTTTIAPAIAGAGALIKTGDGTLTLRGAQDYTTLATLAGTTNLNKALGTGTSSIISNGATNLSESQTLASLDIGPGGVVTVGTPLAAPAPEFVENADAGFGESAVQAVPEPATASLLLLGALGLLGRRRRQD